MSAPLPKVSPAARLTCARLNLAAAPRPLPPKAVTAPLPAPNVATLVARFTAEVAQLLFLRPFAPPRSR